MTYLYQGSCVPGTNLHFQNDDGNLPMDKLQSFWPCRGIGENTSPDLIGNAPLTSDVETWSPSNPCGGSLGAIKNVPASGQCLETSGDATLQNPVTRNKKWWLSFWFYPDTASQVDVLVSNGNQGGPYGWYTSTGIGTSAGSADFVTYGSGSWNTAVNAGTWTVDTWNFMIVGHDGGSGSGTAFASLNGAAAVTQSSQTIAAIGATNQVRISGGGMWEAGEQELDGMIADVAFWVDVSANATAGQIAALYNSGNGNTLVRG